ncbi:MAG: hypothetical protein V1679_01690 [Candidatus Peregrinibacteria bacterium]
MPQAYNPNIPAFRRKQSLAAKARKKPAYLSPKKRTTTKRTTTPRLTRTRIIEPEDELEIPPSFPSEDLFPDPDTYTPSSSSKKDREFQTCGICDGYFDKIDVAVVQVTSPIRKGDVLIFEKEGGLFEQEVDSMQINRRDVSLARSGSDIGLKVRHKPIVGAQVYKLI